jgi:dTDP-4-amino-4,6-dideoxygalactose transaminase
MDPKPFPQPIHITRPILPDLHELTDKLQQIWTSKKLTNRGEQHQLLEGKLKEYLKTPAISLFNNGTIALIVGCQSLRLSGEVITTPFTFPATPHVLAWNNIKPIFCDIHPQTLTINPELIEALITPLTTAILGVHVFGNPCHVHAIQEIADRYGLKVVYDAAHAFGTEVEGQGIGTFGDLSMFSFHATKLFHTAEGGALTFRDPHLKERIEFLKNFGIKNEDEVMMPGINGKMNEIQAALGLLVLDLLGKERKQRLKLLAIYRERFASVAGITLLEPPPEVRPSLEYCVIRINARHFGISRDAVYRELKKFNIFTRKYFYPLCSEYSCYRHLPSANPSCLAVAHEVVQEVLTLPFYGDLTEEEVGRICAILLNLRTK